MIKILRNKDDCILNIFFFLCKDNKLTSYLIFFRFSYNSVKGNPKTFVYDPSMEITPTFPIQSCIP